MYRTQDLYCIENNQMSARRKTYSLDELACVFLQTEPLLESISSPLMKMILGSAQSLSNPEDLVDIYAVLEYSSGRTEKIKLNKWVVRYFSQSYFDILKEGIHMKKDLEGYISRNEFC